MNESIIMSSAAKFDVAKIEKKFNDMVEWGSKNITEMETNVLESCGSVEIELLGNFKDFIYHCIDIQKLNNQALEDQQQQQQPPVDQQPQQQLQEVVSSPPAKKSRKWSKKNIHTTHFEIVYIAFLLLYQKKKHWINFFTKYLLLELFL